MQSFRPLTLLVIFLVLGFNTSAAQSNAARKHGLSEAAPKTMTTESGPGAQAGQAGIRPANPIPPVGFRTAREIIIGFTDYDLQTNSTNCRRISRAADGRIMATWTQGYDEPGYPDRGTGYNIFDGTDWGDAPTGRLEADVRTGWPNHIVTASGKEFIVNHVFSEGEYRLHYLRRNGTSEAWTEGDTPTDTPFGSLWPKATVGGPDGETIHMISITTTTVLDGEVYEGVDGHIIYHRSTDGGETWDITDGIIPGLDNTLMAFTSGDAYDIRARGETVVVATFNQWSDIKIFKSTDNGNTWDSFRIRDFPIDGYNVNDGYDLASLPPDRDTLPGVPEAILTCDESGEILIDSDGRAHVFFGEMFVNDFDTSDEGWFYYPFVSGINYWNESFGPDSTRIIADVEDRNGNDTIDIEGGIEVLGDYGSSLTTTPSAGIDPFGNLYLAYSSVMEGEEYLNEEDGQYYRHIYLTASEDGGETWKAPYDVINPDVVAEPDLFNFVEAVYPTMIGEVGENVEFIYQADFRPGLSAIGDMDEATSNLINFVSIPVLDLGIVRTEEAVRPEYFQLKVQPNPASDEAWVSFDVERNARYTLSLHNLMGQQVTNAAADDAIGRNLHRIGLSGLQPGIYLVRLQAENKVAVARLMVWQGM